MHDIMTIEEVAAYLRISERTVYDWAQKGELPGGKLGTTWRFKREEVERWVNERLSSSSPKSPAASTAATTQALSVDRVILLPSATKLEVLTQLVDLLAETPSVKSRDELLRGILERETLMSTGIGFGVGVPHVRIETVSNLVMAVAVCQTPVDDYASLDNAPVQIVCMLAARKDQHTQYIRALAAISSRLKESLIRERIIQAKVPDDVYRLLTDSEPA